MVPTIIGLMKKICVTQPDIMQLSCHLLSVFSKQQTEVTSVFKCVVSNFKFCLLHQLFLYIIRLFLFIAGQKAFEP